MKLAPAARGSGWITERRARLYPMIVLVAYLLGAIGWVALSNDGVDPRGVPLGGDFIDFYAAGNLAAHGNAGDAYQLERICAAEHRVNPANERCFPFFYPPPYLLLMAPLASLPYWGAFALFMALGAAAYLAVCYRMLPDRGTIPAALAFGASYINSIGGQNGFLTAALLGGGMLLMETQPNWSGLLFGLLLIKPQLTPLLILALVFGRRWRAIAATAATACALTALSALALGWDSWRAFYLSLPLAGAYSATGALPLDKMVSVFAALRVIGFSTAPALAVHMAVAVAVAVPTLWQWRGHGSDFRSKAILLTAATPLISPYFYDYDLVLLALPIALLAAEGIRTGWRPYEQTVLVLAWIAPLAAAALARQLGTPVMPLVLLMLFVVAYRRCRSPIRPESPALQRQS